MTKEIKLKVVESIQAKLYKSLEGKEEQHKAAQARPNIKFEPRKNKK